MTTKRDYIGCYPDSYVKYYVPAEQVGNFRGAGGRLLRAATETPARRVLLPLSAAMKPRGAAEPPREPAAPAEAAKPIKIRGHK